MFLRSFRRATPTATFSKNNIKINMTLARNFDEQGIYLHVYAKEIVLKKYLPARNFRKS